MNKAKGRCWGLLFLYIRVNVFQIEHQVLRFEEVKKVNSSDYRISNCIFIGEASLTNF